jgi:hypothetical protein
LDRLKYLGLGREGWYVTIAGEARERYDRIDYPGFGSGPPDRNGFFLQRYLFSGDFHLGKRFRFFAEMQSGLAHGRIGGPRPTDSNQLEVHQGFVDMDLGRVPRGALVLRAGRQEISFGLGRQISPAEGLNVRRSMDGLRLTYRTGDWVWNVATLRLVKTNPGAFDDTPDNGQSFWGAGVIGPHPTIRRGRISAYYLGTDRKRAVFDRGTGRAIRHTLGSRSWFNGQHWDGSFETIGQWGSFGTVPIRAWAVSSDTGYTFSIARRPRLGLRAGAGSGDSRSGALGAFDPLFPSPAAYSDPAGFFGPTNLIDISPSVRVQLPHGTSVSLSAAAFFRKSKQDAVYSIFLTPVRTGARSEARYIASSATATFRWPINRYLSYLALYERFFLGRFFAETPPNLSATVIVTSLSFRF